MRGKIADYIYPHCCYVIPTDGWSYEAVTGFSQNVMASTQTPKTRWMGTLERVAYMRSVKKERKKEAGLPLSVRTLGCSHGIVCCLVI